MTQRQALSAPAVSIRQSISIRSHSTERGVCCYIISRRRSDCLLLIMWEAILWFYNRILSTWVHGKVLFVWWRRRSIFSMIWRREPWRREGRALRLLAWNGGKLWIILIDSYQSYSSKDSIISYQLSPRAISPTFISRISITLVKEDDFMCASYLSSIISYHILFIWGKVKRVYLLLLRLSVIFKEIIQMYEH